VRVVGMNSIKSELKEVGIDSEGGEDDIIFPRKTNQNDDELKKTHNQVMNMSDFENY